jgi:chemotaxis protein histidine kinase CheA
MRPLLVPQVPWKAILAVLSLSLALPSLAQAQTPAKAQTKTKSQKSKSKSKAKGKSKARSKAKAQQKAPPEEAKAPEPEKAPAEEPAKAQAAEKAPEKTPEKAPEPEKTPAPQKAPAQQKASAPPKAPAPQKVAQPEKEPAERPMSVVQAEDRARAASKMRIGVGLDLFTEKSHLSGEQAINTSRTDESFDFNSSTFLAATLSLSIPAPIFSDRARLGGAVRLFGNYSAGGNRDFGFGLLNQAFVTGEYGLPVANRLEVVFGGRVGMSLLLPGRDFNREIDRLQLQGVDVWSVPRVGWLGGLSVGARRQMNEHIHLRADVSGQFDKTYLFATSQTIEGLQFSKSWSTNALRLGFTVGAEFSL